VLQLKTGNDSIASIFVSEADVSVSPVKVKQSKGRPAITGFIVREQHSVLKYGMSIVSMSSSFRNY
jgi:hypothetical protein